MRSAFRALPAIALVAVAALVGGCGSNAANQGSDNGGGNGKPANPISKGDSKGPKVSANNFCDNYKVYVLSGMTVGLASFAGMKDDPDLEKAIDAMENAVDNLAEHAPSEIRDEFVMVRDYTDKWVAELDKGNTDPPAETPEYEAASDRIIKFGKKECGDIIPMPTAPSSK